MSKELIENNLFHCFCQISNHIKPKIKEIITVATQNLVDLSNCLVDLHNVIGAKKFKEMDLMTKINYELKAWHNDLISVSLSSRRSLSRLMTDLSYILSTATGGENQELLSKFNAISEPIRRPWDPSLNVRTGECLRDMLLDLVLIVDPDIKGNFEARSEDFGLINSRISEMTDKTKAFLNLQSLKTFSQSHRIPSDNNGSSSKNLKSQEELLKKGVIVVSEQKVSQGAAEPASDPKKPNNLKNLEIEPYSSKKVITYEVEGETKKLTIQDIDKKGVFEFSEQKDSTGRSYTLKMIEEAESDYVCEEASNSQEGNRVHYLNKSEAKKFISQSEPVVRMPPAKAGSAQKLAEMLKKRGDTITETPEGELSTKRIGEDEGSGQVFVDGFDQKTQRKAPINLHYAYDLPLSIAFDKNKNNQMTSSGSLKGKQMAKKVTEKKTPPCNAKNQLPNDISMSSSTREINNLVSSFPASKKQITINQVSEDSQELHKTQEKRSDGQKINLKNSKFLKIKKTNKTSQLESNDLRSPPRGKKQLHQVLNNSNRSFNFSNNTFLPYICGGGNTHVNNLNKSISSSRKKLSALADKKMMRASKNSSSILGGISLINRPKNGQKAAAQPAIDFDYYSKETFGAKTEQMASDMNLAESTVGQHSSTLNYHNFIESSEMNKENELDSNEMSTNQLLKAKMITDSKVKLSTLFDKIDSNVNSRYKERSQEIKRSKRRPFHHPEDRSSSKKPKINQKRVKKVLGEHEEEPEGSISSVSSEMSSGFNDVYQFNAILKEISNHQRESKRLYIEAKRKEREVDELSCSERFRNNPFESKSIKMLAKEGYPMNSTAAISTSQPSHVIGSQPNLHLNSQGLHSHQASKFIFNNGNIFERTPKSRQCSRQGSGAISVSTRSFSRKNTPKLLSSVRMPCTPPKASKKLHTMSLANSGAKMSSGRRLRPNNRSQQQMIYGESSSPHASKSHKFGFDVTPKRRSSRKSSHRKPKNGHQQEDLFDNGRARYSNQRRRRLLKPGWKSLRTSSRFESDTKSRGGSASRGRKLGVGIIRRFNMKEFLLGRDSEKIHVNIQGVQKISISNDGDYLIFGGHGLHVLDISRPDFRMIRYDKSKSE